MHPINPKGFTLIEVAIVIMIIGIMTAVAIFGYSRVVEQAKFDATQKKLENIKKAIAGDPDLIAGGARTSFGYFGDVGNAPANLTNLVINPGAPVYDPNTGMGWNGPYLDPGFGTDYQNDGWGVPFGYTVDGAGNITIGSSSGATPQSVTIASSELMPTAANPVRVYVHTATAPTLGAVVTIDYPTNGASATANPSAQSNGYYSFTGIPYGKRVVIVNGQRCNNTAGTFTITPTGNIVDCKI